MTDIAKPANLATLSYKWQWADSSQLDARLVNPSTIAWVDWTTPRGDLVESTTGSSLKTLASRNGNSVISFAWSPLGDEWTYLANTPTALEWHLVIAGRDRAFASLPPIPAHGGSPRLEPFMVTFSADGKLVAMIDGIGDVDGSGDRAKMQIRRADGSPVSTDADARLIGGFVSDLLWVGSSLYFRDQNGIEVWSQNGVCSVMPGVQWIRPKLSPNGKFVVFHTEDAHQLSHVYLYDLTTQHVKRVSPAGGAEAWFLGSDHVWFLEERLCAPTEPCGVSNSRPTGRALIADLATSTTSESRITRIADSWPRPGAPNFENFWWMDAAAPH